ncbi:hypothetical protein ACFWDQ_26685 [Streptomyces sp. NPDC060053]|uniref:hypothetical protein n=1 Tax=Streptomyces sp. NPDC060053 TaxID=3347047 RepID=UPI00369CE73E
MLVDEDEEDDDEDEEDDDEEDDDEFVEFDESEAEFEPEADASVPSSVAGADGGCSLVPVAPEASVVPEGAVTVPP